LKNEEEELTSNYQLVTGELNPKAPGKRNRKRRRGTSTTPTGLKKPRTNKPQSSSCDSAVKQVADDELKKEESQQRAGQDQNSAGQDQNMTDQPQGELKLPQTLDNKQPLIQDIEDKPKAPQNDEKAVPTKKRPKKKQNSKQPLTQDIEHKPKAPQNGEKAVPTKKRQKKTHNGDNQPKFDLVTTDQNKINERLVRFKGTHNETGSTETHNKSVQIPGSVIGVSQQIEKDFFRLTCEADPSKVRPLEILKKSLLAIKKHWLLSQNYDYTHNQLKSIRQDLTVQSIKTPFTLQVYETHARIALEMKDLGTFSDCMSVALSLYETGLEGNRLEFRSYSILYALYLKDKNSVTLQIQGLSTSDIKDKAVSHAISVVKAVDAGDYHQFFSLYLASPNMSDYLLDLMMDKIRTKALKTIASVYQDPVPISKICSELAFKNKRECLQFLETTKHKFDNSSLYPLRND